MTGNPYSADESSQSSSMVGSLGKRSGCACWLQRASLWFLIVLALVLSSSHYVSILDVAPGLLQPEFSSVLVHLSDIFLVGAAVCWTIANLLMPDQPIHTTPWIVTVTLGLLAGWGTLSLLWTDSISLTAAYALRWWLLWGLYILARQSPLPTRDHIALAWIVAGLVQSTVALIQFFQQHEVGLRWMGEMVRDAYVPGCIVVQVGPQLWLRAAGLSSSPNALGGFLVVAVLLLVGYVLSRRRRDRKRTVLLGALMTVLTAAMLSTFSRASWLGLAVGLSLISCAVWRKSSRQTRAELIAVASLLIAVTLAFAIAYWPLFSVRFVGTAATLWPQAYTANMTEQANIAQREHYQSIAMDLWMSSPWLGVGLGNSSLAALLRFPPLPGETSHAPVHSVPLLLLVELGPIGLFAWLALAGGVIWQLWNQRDILSTRPIYVAWSAAVVSILVMGCFDHHYLTYQQGRLALWLTLGVWAAG